MQPYQGDIIVIGPDAQPQLLVEVKNRSAASAEWAAQLRRNLVVHFGLANTPFFLLALPDTFYFWKTVASEPPTVEPVAPSYAMSARLALAQFLPQGDSDLTTEAALELVVAAWLQELVRPDSISDGDNKDRDWLRSSGLLDAIRGGEVLTHVLA